MTEPFAVKFSSRIQKKISPNINDGLNFVTGEKPTDIYFHILQTSYGTNKEGNSKYMGK